MKRVSLAFVALMIGGLWALTFANDKAGDAYLKWRGGAALENAASVSFAGTLTTAGLSGDETMILTPRNYRAEYDLKVVKGATVIGPDGAFSQTANGQVQIMGGSEREAQLRWLDLIFATPFRDGRAVAQKDQSKDGQPYHVLRVSYGESDAWDYFVRNDGTLDWVRVREDLETYWIQLSDWRVVDGVRLPFKDESFREQAAQNTRTDWKSATVNAALSVDAFARPVAPRKLLSFDRGDTATIPVDMFLSVRVFVPVTINGVETTAILDSGAELTVIDAAFAAKAGVKGAGEVAAIGTGGTTTASMASDVALKMPGATLSHLAPAIFDLSELNSRFGRPLNVIIGRELFNEAVVDVDYAAKTLTLHDAASFSYRGPGKSVKLISGKGGITQVQVSVEGHPPGLFDFDLGNGSALVVFHSAAKAWGIEDGRKSAKTMGGGIGGTRVDTAVTLREVSMGPFSFADVPTSISGTEAGAFNTKELAGNIGAGVFKKFRVLVDMTRGALYLEPYADQIKAPFDRDRMGVSLREVEGKLTVAYVVPGGPADAAGLKKDAVVTAIDGTVVNERNWSETARSAFIQAAGKTVKLTLDGGRVLSVVLADYF